MDWLVGRTQSYRIAKNPSQYAKKHVTVRRKIRDFPLAFLGVLQVHLSVDGGGEGKRRTIRRIPGELGSGRVETTAASDRLAENGRLLPISKQAVMKRPIEQLIGADHCLMSACRFSHARTPAPQGAQACDE